MKKAWFGFIGSLVGITLFFLGLANWGFGGPLWYLGLVGLGLAIPSLVILFRGPKGN